MTTHHRTIWVSDIHLGMKFSSADRLVAFFEENTADTIYLVGDIIDLWALSRKVYFPQPHIEAAKRILALSQAHRVVYIRGNHDETLDHFIPFNVGAIEVVEEATHITADGRRLLVTHGDKYDQVMQYARWLAVLGDLGYTFLLKSNAWVNWVRRRFGFGHWSLSAYAKRKVKTVVGFIGDFEACVARDARDRGFDGAVCGHIHHCSIKDIDGVFYANSGDWVESCTALVEDADGTIRMVDRLT